jgi:Trehalose utilisation
MMDKPRFRIVSFLATVLGCCVIASAAKYAAPNNTPPPESTSKVKRVLLYSKVGGWVAVNGIANVKQYLGSLALAKGFELDTIDADTNITIEYLKQYQVIVWNNNNNAAVSVPTASARSAIVEYVNQGGGWFLIGLAGDHANSWPALTDMLGASFTRWGAQGEADMQVDSSAQKHPELRFVINSLPNTIRLNDIWMSFNRTVRPLANTTVLYTSQGGAANVLVPPEDGSGDRAYVWARTIVKGKLLYCPPGWSPVQQSQIAQSDSAVAKLYWNSMRWLAGDFQNGCTDPNSTRFNLEARVDDGSCQQVNILGDQRRKRYSMQASKKTSFQSRVPLIKGEESGANRDVRGRMIHLPEVTPKPDPKN